MSYMFLCPTEAGTQALGDWHIKTCGMNHFNKDLWNECIDFISQIIRCYHNQTVFDYERPFSHHKVSLSPTPSPTVFR